MSGRVDLADLVAQRESKAGRPSRFVHKRFLLATTQAVEQSNRRAQVDSLWAVHGEGETWQEQRAAAQARAAAREREIAEEEAQYAAEEAIQQPEVAAEPPLADAVKRGRGGGGAQAHEPRQTNQKSSRGRQSR